jgi:hypothetical protein
MDSAWAAPRSRFGCYRKQFWTSAHDRNRGQFRYIGAERFVMRFAAKRSFAGRRARRPEEFLNGSSGIQRDVAELYPHAAGAMTKTCARRRPDPPDLRIDGDRPTIARQSELQQDLVPHPSGAAGGDEETAGADVFRQSEVARSLGLDLNRHLEGAPTCAFRQMSHVLIHRMSNSLSTVVDPLRAAPTAEERAPVPVPLQRAYPPGGS